MNDIDVTAFFVADPNCYDLLPDAYDAPQPCPCDVAALPFTTQNGMVCAGASIDLSTLVFNTNGGALTYYTTFADAQNDTNALMSSIVSPSSATNYYVRKTLGSNCFLVNEITVTIQPRTCGVILISGPN